MSNAEIRLWHLLVILRPLCNWTKPYAKNIEESVITLVTQSCSKCIKTKLTFSPLFGLMFLVYVSAVASSFIFAGGSSSFFLFVYASLHVLLALADARQLSYPPGRHRARESCLNAQLILTIHRPPAPSRKTIHKTNIINYLKCNTIFQTGLVVLKA